MVPGVRSAAYEVCVAPFSIKTTTCLRFTDALGVVKSTSKRPASGELGGLPRPARAREYYNARRSFLEPILLASRN